MIFKSLEEVNKARQNIYFARLNAAVLSDDKKRQLLKEEYAKVIRMKKYAFTKEDTFRIAKVANVYNISKMHTCVAFVKWGDLYYTCFDLEVSDIGRAYTEDELSLISPISKYGIDVNEIPCDDLGYGVGYAFLLTYEFFEKYQPAIMLYCKEINIRAIVERH